MAEYLNIMRQYKNDLTQLGNPITESRFMHVVIQGLPKTYDSWIERYRDITADPTAPVPTMRSVEAQLIAKETRLLSISAAKGKGGNERGE